MLIHLYFNMMSLDKYGPHLQATLVTLSEEHLGWFPSQNISFPHSRGFTGDYLTLSIFGFLYSLMNLLSKH